LLLPARFELKTFISLIFWKFLLKHLNSEFSSCLYYLNKQLATEQEYRCAIWFLNYRAIQELDITSMRTKNKLSLVIKIFQLNIVICHLVLWKILLHLSQIRSLFIFYLFLNHSTKKRKCWVSFFRNKKQWLMKCCLTLLLAWLDEMKLHTLAMPIITRF
jgi:hypothetical protein